MDNTYFIIDENNDCIYTIDDFDFIDRDQINQNIERVMVIDLKDNYLYTKTGHWDLDLEINDSNWVETGCVKHMKNLIYFWVI
ncbi:unnamed protein product [marine sediment metagenome]|uniref:Uncharacterized protein n=1 Tax=marine sediment metagenome TaxID=412755 RepID=X0ZQN3_9ZZZZ